MTALLTLVLCATPVRLDWDPQVLGWAKDGSAFVWTFTDTMWESKPGQEDSDDPNSRVTTEVANVANVWDPGTAKVTQYLLSYKEVSRLSKGFLKTNRYPGAEGPTAFNTWKKSVGGLVAKTGFEGPSGARAEVFLDGEPGTSWKLGESPPKVELRAVKGTGRCSDSFEDGNEAMFTASRSVQVWWDAQGRRAMFLVWTEAAQTMRGMTPPRAEGYVVPVPPRIELLASARLSSLSASVRGTLVNARYVVEAEGVSQKDRTATVIYAPPGFEADAKKLQALVPGATIEKLTWKANGDVIIALGAPAEN